MRKLLLFIAGSAIAAGLAYLFGTKSGRERRDSLRGNLEEATGRILDQAETGFKQAESRAGKARESIDNAAAHAGR